MGNIRMTCRYFGVGRSTFYRWKSAYEKCGESGLANKSTVPKHHPKQLSQEVVDKVLHLRRNFSRPHGAFNGRTPYEALREKLQ